MHIREIGKDCGIKYSGTRITASDPNPTNQEWLNRAPADRSCPILEGCPLVPSSTREGVSVGELDITIPTYTYCHEGSVDGGGGTKYHQ